MKRLYAVPDIVWIILTGLMIGSVLCAGLR